MISSINQILKEAKAEKKSGKGKIPKCITKEMEEMMFEILKLLQPFANLTDALQGDDVTSSLVIPGLLDAVKGYLNMKQPNYFMTAYMNNQTIFYSRCGQSRFH